jgi:signal peptidase I
MPVRSLVLVLIAAGCGHASPPPPPPPASPVSPLLAAVGPHPRGYARISLAELLIRAQLAPFAAEMAREFGKSPADCHIDLERLDRVQVAIGEPLRIAAELDGKIDLAAITCLLGDDRMAALAGGGVAFHNRPGGIEIDFQADRTRAVPATGAELMQRCAGATCAAAVLGPRSRPLWLQVRLDKIVRFMLGGPGMGHGAAEIVAAIDQLRATTPALRALVAREQHGSLVIELPNPDAQATTAMSLALRAHLLEAFKIPSSSMVPTLMVDDHVFAAKGPLLGTPVPGDLLIYNFDGHPFVKRYLAGPGQTITETDAGLSIDGKRLATELVDPDFHYLDRDEVTHQEHDRSGIVLREHLGARSYLTLRSGPPHVTATWTVPAGRLFFVGDSRNNSNDSRYNDPTPQDAIIGRVIGIWLAFRDGAPDWDRMGTPVE